MKRRRKPRRLRRGRPSPRPLRQAGDAAARAEHGEQQAGLPAAYLEGVIYFQKGDYEKARDKWLHAKQLDPSNSDAAAGLEKIEKLYGAGNKAQVMKLSAKWFLWFTGIGVYVMFLGGIFYYNLFKWTFDEKLKQESIDMVRLYAPTLIEGLSRNQSVISMAEFDTVSRFSKDDRVAALLYLNKYGEVRWFKDPSMMTKTFDEFSSSRSACPPTPSSRPGSRNRRSCARCPTCRSTTSPFPWPLRGRSSASSTCRSAAKGVVKVINKAMHKYAVGAVGVLLLLGIPLYFFLHHFVLNPLLNLRDAIEAISFKNLELKFPARNDEIGELAGAINIFLSKVKAEISNSMVKEKQRGVAEARWWESILKAVVSKNHRAIVVDEDNSVLYTNFPVTGTVTTDGKLHLLDVIDSQQQDVLRLVGVALDRPNQVVEADTMFKSESCHVKAVHLEEEGELRRTLILFETRGRSSRRASPKVRLLSKRPASVIVGWPADAIKEIAMSYRVKRIDPLLVQASHPPDRRFPRRRVGSGRRLRQQAARRGPRRYHRRRRHSALHAALRSPAP